MATGYGFTFSFAGRNAHQCKNKETDDILTHYIFGEL